MKSIRSFLLLSMMLAMSAVMLAAGVFSYQSSVHEIDEIFDARLAQYTRLLSSTAKYSSEKISIPVWSPGSAGHKYESRIFFQIWNNDGVLLEATENVRDVSAPVPFVEGFHQVDINGQTSKIFVLQSDSRWYITGETLAIRKELERNIAWTAVMPLLAGTVLSLFISSLILIKGLSPLGKVSAAIRQRRAEDMSPLPLDSIPDEISSLVENINELLSRLSASFDRERRFSADAAHEIKTPLAALKLHLENLKPSLPDHAHGLYDKAKHCSNEIQRLIEQLLFLNRLEPQYFSHSLKPVALVPVCREVFSQEAESALVKHQHIELKADDESLLVYGDVALLQVLLRNLLRNAILYTQVNGRISMEVSGTAEEVVVSVTDNGPGIPDNEREQVFERFYRIGGDSHAGPSGSGLGLAIAREIVRLHKGQIKLQTASAGRGLVVCMTFPRCDSL